MAKKLFQLGLVQQKDSMTNKKICCSTLNLFKLAEILTLVELLLYAFALAVMLLCCDEDSYHTQYLKHLKFDVFVQMKTPIIIILICYKINLIIEYNGIQAKNVKLLNFSCFIRLLQMIVHVGIMITIMIKCIYGKGEFKFE